MKKNNKAFTLIELLAIIVILAIIAVITVPIILNIIDNSRMGAAIDSAYGYKDAVQKYYVTKSVEDTTQELPSGFKSVSSLPSDFTVSGEKPSDGWLKLNNGNVEEYSLKIGDYVVTKTDDGDVSSIKNGEIAIPNNEVLDNIASYFSNDIDRIVYYNPIDGVYCNKETDSAVNKYDPDNSKPEYKGLAPETNDLGQTRCLKWFKYSINKDGTINIILDHDTELSKPWYLPTNNDYTYGATGIMDYLTFPEWKGVPIRSDIYIAYGINSDNEKIKMFTNLEGNALNYSGKKARLITAQEIAEITGANEATSPGIGWDEQNTSSREFVFNDGIYSGFPRNVDSPSDYYWLFENLVLCQEYGCLNENNDYRGNTNISNVGYWTSSPFTNFYYFGSLWVVSKYGDLKYVNPNNSSDWGVRPVITIPAS